MTGGRKERLHTSGIDPHRCTINDMARSVLSQGVAIAGGGSEFLNHCTGTAQIPMATGANAPFLVFRVVLHAVNEAFLLPRMFGFRRCSSSSVN